MTSQDQQDENLRVEIARLSGKLETIIAQMKAGDKQAEQLVTLVKDQLTFHAADLGELKAVVREMTVRTETGMNVVRQDLEKRLAEQLVHVNARIDAHTVRLNDHSADIDKLNLWRARIGGIAAASAALGGVVGSAIFKTVGA